MKSRSANLLKQHRALWILLASFVTLQPASAHASLFKGETLDKVADVLAWVVLVVAPIVAIAVFWLVHILPEKIAEKKKHPQAKAIQTLCLLSLVFGGLLWPLAWLWAYTKPVFYKSAYGTDIDEDHGHDRTKTASPLTDGHGRGDRRADVERLKRLRAEMLELETQLAKQEGEKN